MSFCIAGGIPLYDDSINITGTLEALINKEILYFDRIWIDHEIKTIWVDHIYSSEFRANLYCDIAGRKGRDDNNIKYLNGYKVILIQ